MKKNDKIDKNEKKNETKKERKKENTTKKKSINRYFEINSFNFRRKLIIL